MSPQRTAVRTPSVELSGLFKSHQWTPRPLVTLEQQETWGQVTWHPGNAVTAFTDPGIFNFLIVQVEFKYYNPYGGHADYKVVIDVASGSNWTNVQTDTVHHYTDRPDDTWYTKTKDYSLRMSTTGTLAFRIGVSIELGGSLPTGSGGSLGEWLPLEYREFRATFARPKPEWVLALTAEYKRRFEIPAGP